MGIVGRSERSLSAGRWGGISRDYFRVPVGASWETRVIGSFPKIGKPWNKAKNSWPRVSCEVRMMMVVMAPSVSWA